VEYVAVHHLTIARRSYTPGEVIQSEIERGALARYLQKGAVIMAGAGYEAPGADNGAPGASRPTAGMDEMTEWYGAADEEAPPEIDVSEGIVDQPKPAAKRRAKK